MHTAASLNFTDIAKLLLNYANPNVQSHAPHKVTPIWLAAQNGNLAIVQDLVGHGADINIVRADTGIPPLYVAMQKKHVEVAKELIKLNARLDINANELTPLHISASLGDIDVFNAVIVPTNTIINNKNNGGGTALFCAAYAGHKNVVEALINRGADINIQSNDGFYPFHAAALNCLKKYVK